MTPAWTLALLVAASSTALAAPLAPVARFAPKGYPARSPATAIHQLDTTSYLYVAAVESSGAHGAGAGGTIVQADPALGVGDFHSLAEIAVESSDSQQIVELGWNVDIAVNGDLQPHVFAFHWVDGQQTCYNACGWVQVSPDKAPGMRIVPGESHRYEIKLVGGDWWLFYDGEGMGYYPQSLWTTTAFKQSGYVQWFGEVAAAGTAPCTQMGNGKLGADSAAAVYSDLHLFDPDGTTVQGAASVGALTDTDFYNIGQITPTSFGFGGPGAATGCCTPSTCQAQQAECGSIADPVCAGNTLSCGACLGAACTADHRCPSGIGPRDIGELFDTPIPDRSGGGGCCDAGPSSSGSSGAGSLALGALVALVVRRRRTAQR